MEELTGPDKLAGFSFDNTNRSRFVSQRCNGASENSSDLCITQLDFSGKILRYMHLTGFGHGMYLARRQTAQ